MIIFKNKKKKYIFTGAVIILFLTLVSCPLPIDESLVTVVEDKISPELSIITPKTNSAYKGTLTVTGSLMDSALQAGDNKGFIKSLELTVLDVSRLNRTVTFAEDGTYKIDPEDSTFTYARDGGVFSIQISTVGLSGVQVITFTALDKNNNSSEKVITLQEDTSGPYINLTSPANLLTYGIIVNITGTVLNAQGDTSTNNVKKLAWQISPAGISEELDLSSTTPQADGTYKLNKFTFNPTTGAFYDEASLIGKKGNQYLEFTSEDLNGHVSSETRQLIDSAEGPQVAITSYDQWYSSVNTTNTTVAGTIVIDDPTNFDSLAYVIEQLSAPSIGNPITNYDLTAKTFSFSFDPVSNGMSDKLVITVTATDKAGRESSVAVDMYDDTNPPSAPVVGGTTPTNDTTPTWNWTNPSDAADVRYQIDSESAGGWTTAGSVVTSYSPVTALSEGSHTLYVQAQDAAGNWSASGSYAITVDTTPPGPPNGFTGTTPTNDTTPTWNWTNPSGAADVRYQMDSELGSWTTAGSAITTHTPSLPLSETSHRLYVQAQDSAGNWSASGSYAINVDTTALDPPYGFTGTTPTMDETPTWDWTNRSGTVNVRYQMDSEVGSWITAGSVVTSYTPGANLTQGSHTLYVQIQDAAGNWSLSGSYSITVDSIPDVTGPSLTNDNTPTWTWTNPSDAVDIRYQMDSETGTWTDTLGLSTSYTSGSLSDGDHTLFVQAQDSSSNWHPSGSWTVTVDTTPPSPPNGFTGTTPTNDTTPTWNWTNPSGTADVRYQMDYENAGGWTTAGSVVTSYSPVTALSEGSHTLYVQAQDAAGNWSASGSYNITVDTTPPGPVISLTAPTPTTDTTPTWTWTLPGDADIADILYYLDSGPYTSGGMITEFTPSSPLSIGDHTLHVKVQDTAGNESSEEYFTVTVQ